MEKTTEKLITERSFQDYLSMGYLFLLILGIVREVVFYRFLDVNILSYSNVLDVLLSPLTFLAKNPKATGTLLFACCGLYFLVKYLEKKKIQNSDSEPKEGIKVDTNSIDGFLFLFALLFISFFLGTGIGSGFKTAKKLKGGEYTATHQLTFTDGEKEAVKLIGNNSQYVFYVEEKGTMVATAPIPGNIKKIEKLPKKKEENKKVKQK